MAKKELSVVEDNLPAMYDPSELEGLTDYGYSTRAEDKIVPMLKLLQSNSPECLRSHEKYVKGSEAGDLYVPGYQKLFNVHETPMIFQPCAFKIAYVAYHPRDEGGGYVATYPEMPDGTREEEDEKGRKHLIYDGLEIVFTRYHFGHILEDSDVLPVVIPFTSTGHGVSRNWTLVLDMQKIPGTKQRAPAWFYSYLLTTAMRTNKAGNWFVINFEKGKYLDTDIRALGRTLHDAIIVGDKEADHGTIETASPGDKEVPF